MGWFEDEWGDCGSLIGVSICTRILFNCANIFSKFFSTLLLLFKESVRICCRSEFVLEESDLITVRSAWIF